MKHIENVLEKDPTNWEAIFNISYNDAKKIEKTDFLGCISKIKESMYIANNNINNSGKTYFEKRIAKISLINKINFYAGISLLIMHANFTKLEKKTQQDVEEMKKKCMAVAFLERDCADLFFDYDGIDNTLIQRFVNGAAINCIATYVDGMAKLKPYLEPEDLDGEYVDEVLAYPISLLKIYKKEYKAPDNIHPL